MSIEVFIHGYSDSRNFELIVLALVDDDLIVHHLLSQPVLFRCVKGFSCTISLTIMASLIIMFKSRILFLTFMYAILSDLKMIRDCEICCRFCI